MLRRRSRGCGRGRSPIGPPSGLLRPSRGGRSRLGPARLGAMPKVTVTLDPELLARVDAARAPGQTRSGFIAAALTDRLASPPDAARPHRPAVADPVRSLGGVIGRGGRGRTS